MIVDEDGMLTYDEYLTLLFKSTLLDSME